MEWICTVKYTVYVLRMLPIARLAAPTWVGFKDRCFEQVPCIYRLPKANLDVLSRWPLLLSPRIPCIPRDWSNLRRLVPIISLPSDLMLSHAVDCEGLK